MSRGFVLPSQISPPITSGPVLLQTLTLSASGSAQFTDGIMTSTYSHYQVVVAGHFGSGSTMFCQMRNAGATVATASYALYATGWGSNDTADTRSTSGTTSWSIGYGANYDAPLYGVYNFFNPSSETIWPHAVGVTAGTNAGINAVTVNNIGLRFGASQVFTSLLFTSAGFFTGVISLYGVTK